MLSGERRKRRAGALVGRAEKRGGRNGLPAGEGEEIEPNRENSKDLVLIWVRWLWFKFQTRILDSDKFQTVTLPGNIMAPAKEETPW